MQVDLLNQGRLLPSGCTWQLLERAGYVCRTRDFLHRIEEVRETLSTDSTTDTEVATAMVQIIQDTTVPTNEGYPQLICENIMAQTVHSLNRRAGRKEYCFLIKPVVKEEADNRKNKFSDVGLHRVLRNLLEAVKSRVKNDRYASIKVALAETDSSHFFPFSGGGDIYLQTDHSSACLRLSDEDDGEAEALGAEEGTQVSPRKKGELRCTGAVETKFSVQSVDKVLRQLQADMLVGATQQLKTIVTNEPTKAKDIKSFSTYGITFGVSIAHPLIVLKMTLDFETNVLDYLQLCRYEWSETFNVYVDGAFEYVMERVALPTPSPPR